MNIRLLSPAFIFKPVIRLHNHLTSLNDYED